MEILGKFGSALQGFWWALDEQERIQVLLAGAYLVWLAVGLPLAARRKQREMDELALRVAALVESRRDA